MSASTPANRRSTPGARRFDYCRFIELDYVPMETGYMVSMRPTKGPAPTRSPTKGFGSTKSPDRHSRSTNSPSSTPRSRRTPATPSNRDPFGNPSLSSSSNSGSCKGSDCSPTKGRQKYTSCTDNHGIRPPPPEQYLTPLQQKEVCIRHLRAKLKETIHTLQDRDTEIDALRGQLFRMQEDWVEEECHRVEAQLALKEARQEIQQLKGAVETVRARLGDGGGVPAGGDAVLAQKYFQDINAQNHKLENLLLHMDLAQADAPPPAAPPPGRRARVSGGSAPASVSGESPGAAPKMAARAGGRGSSCSCDASPARSLNLTRSSTYTKLSEPPLGTMDSGFVCDGGIDDGDHGNHGGVGGVPSRADLLLEAAFLSEETASLLSCYSQNFSISGSIPHTYPHTLPRSTPHAAMPPPHAIPHAATCERLCAAPVCGSHPCLSQYHHLYLHPLREAGIQTESCPLDLDTVAEQRTFRSQACSPTSTWLSDEAEEDLDSIVSSTSVSMATVTEPIPASRTPPAPGLPRSATVAFSTQIQGGGGGRQEGG